MLPNQRRGWDNSSTNQQTTQRLVVALLPQRRRQTTEEKGGGKEIKNEHMDQQTDKAKRTRIKRSVKRVNQEYKDLLKYKFHSINRFLTPTGQDPDSGHTRPDSATRGLSQEGGRILSPAWEREEPLGSPHSPRDATPAPSDSTHPPPTSAMVDLEPPASSTGVTEAFTGGSLPQGEKEKPAGTWVANLAQGEDGQGTSSESRPSNSDTNGGDLRHQAPSTNANVEGSGEEQAFCTREHQNPGTAQHPF